MYIIAWRYEVSESAREDFRKTYGSDGAWAALFRAAPDYLETRLFEDCDAPGSFVTFDIWTDEDSHARFLEEYRDSYDRLDAATAHLTTHDERIGRIVPAVWNT